MVLHRVSSAAGSSLPQTASTSVSVGTTRPARKARQATRACLFAPGTSTGCPATTTSNGPRSRTSSSPLACPPLCRAVWHAGRGGVRSSYARLARRGAFAAETLDQPKAYATAGPDRARGGNGSSRAGHVPGARCGASIASSWASATIRLTSASTRWRRAPRPRSAPAARTPRRPAAEPRRSRSRRSSRSGRRSRRPAPGSA